MQDTIEIIQDHLEDVKIYNLTPEQKTHLKGRFNCFGNFEYGITKDKDFIFNTRKDSFNRMEYYRGNSRI